MNQTQEPYFLYDRSSELARTFESKNHMKIKTTRHRDMENGHIWEGISLINACWVSQSVFYQVKENV